MKTALITLLSAGLVSSVFAADADSTLKTDKEKLSYSIGMDIGQNLKRSQVDVDPETLSKGLKDFLTGNKTLLTDEQKREVMTNFQKEMREKQMARMKEQQEKGKEA